MEKAAIDEAFLLFSQETLRLEKAYLSLQEQFKTLHAKLDASKNTLESLVDHLSEGLIFINMDGIISIFNKAAEKLTGYTQKNIVGKAYKAFFDDELFGFSIEKTLRGQKVDKKIFLQMHCDTKKFELFSSPFFVTNLGVGILLHDVTEMQKLQTALSQHRNLKELGEMAAILAHEIRNPLAGIEGFTSLLAQDLKGKQLEMTSHILNASRTLNRLVTNVLHYAKPLELHFTSCDLNTLIQDALALIFCKTKPLFKTSHRACIVNVDKDLLSCAFLNLVKNALEVTDENEPIVISFQQKKDSVKLAIQDRGPGICPEHFSSLFTPFFTTKQAGTGLGLSDAHKIIQAHGGSIEVDSKMGLGSKKGSTFTIVLPL